MAYSTRQDVQARSLESLEIRVSGVGRKHTCRTWPNEPECTDAERDGPPCRRDRERRNLGEKKPGGKKPGLCVLASGATDDLTGEPG